MSRFLFIVLWVLTVLLVLFSVISFAGVVTRIPALISLCIAITFSLYRKRFHSWIWVTGYVVGIMVFLGAVYLVVTAQGTSATFPSRTAEQGIQAVIPQKQLNTEELAFEWRDNLLKEMSNPSQGEDCINTSCTVTATLFSGPSVSKANVTLNMAYMEYHDWYILIAPTTRDSLHVAQELIQRSVHFPYDTGVMIVRNKTVDYYWIDQGTEFGKSVKEHT